MLYCNLILVVCAPNPTYLFQYDGSIPEYGVSVELDEQIRGANAEQLGRGDGVRRLCGG